MKSNIALRQILTLSVVLSLGATQALAADPGELRFHALIDRIESAFAPDVAARGKTLYFERLWPDARVNAQITRDDSDNPLIRVYGGLGRDPVLSDDAFLLILCHELGHYLGGAPKAPRGNSGKKSWSSTEGQADYFATSKCMKRLLAEEASGEKTGERSRRILEAALEAARFFSRVTGGGSPSLAKKDPTVVGETMPGHPAPQCRLDTYVAGTLCDAPATLGFDDEDPTIGACGLEEQKAPGARPLCWYSPEL